MTMLFPVENLLDPNTEKSQHFHLTEEIENKIKLAQQDHVSVQFKKGVIRLILADIGNDIKTLGHCTDVKDGSFAQFVASEIANEYNLASHIMFFKNQYSLVVVSQLGGPRDYMDCLIDLLKNFEMK